MEEKKHINKKGRISLLKVLIIAVVLLVLIMIYMGTLLKNYNAESTDANEVVNAVVESNHPEFNNAKIYPDKEYVFQKEVVSNDDSDVSYSLVLPFINLNIKEAQDLNSKLENYYNKNKAYYNDEKIATVLPELYYDYSFTGEILDLKIIYFVENSNSICEDYHIDVKNGKFLSRDEFLNHCGIDSDKLSKLIDESLLYSYFSYASNEKKNSVMEFDDYKKNTTILDSSLVVENNEYDSKKISEAIENDIQSENYIYDYKKICENCSMHFREDDVIEIYNICLPDSSYPVIYVNMDLKYVIPTHHNYTISNTFEDNTYYITSKVPFINIDSEDVNKINRELRQYFDNLSQICDKTDNYIVLGTLNGSNSAADEVFLNKEMKKVIDEYYAINYAYTIINDKVLSMIVLEEKNPSSYGIKTTKYLNYNIDIETGKIISNNDFIKLFGMDESTFNEKLNAKLKLVSNNKTIPYDFDKLQITFCNPSELFYAPNFKANNMRYAGHFDEQIKNLSVLGKNFDVYPHVWVDLFFDENEDTKAADIIEKQSVLDVTKIDEIIDEYDGSNKETKLKVSDSKDVLYYLFDFDDDGIMECIISYNNRTYIYRKQMKEPLLISWDSNIKIYEVKNRENNKHEILLKDYNKHDLCFEDFMLASLSIEKNSFVYRTIYGYSCNTEKEKQLREAINQKSFDNYEERQKSLIEAHTLDYYYNTNYNAELRSNLDMEYVIVNDPANISKEEYDEYSHKFLSKYELVYTNDDESIFDK